MKNKRLSIKVTVRFEPNRFSGDVITGVYERITPQQKHPITDQAAALDANNEQDHNKSQVKEHKS